MTPTPVDLLITHASELLTCRVDSGRGARGADLSALEVIPDGAVAIAGDRIVAVGPTAELEPGFRARTTIDATGRLVSPGLVDPHTHPVHAGTRHLEWGARLTGATNGPGIQNGIAATRRATADVSREELACGLHARLDTMLAHGTTTAEAKSGYGVSPADELRLLDALALAEHPVELAVTYLGAHVTPGPAAHDVFVGEVIAELERARAVAEYCDVCCDPVGFTPAECERIARAAYELGFGIRVHADQTGPYAGAELAIRLDAASADHLEYVSDRAIAMFAESPTVAILLPTVSYHMFSLVRGPGPHAWHEAPHAWLGERFRRLIDAGALVALATDYNPGSSPTLSMQAAMQAAARLYRLGYAEIWYASTINAAVSLGRGDRVGSLEVGKQADVVLWDVPTHELVINQFGTNLVRSVVKAGELVHGAPARSTTASATPRRSEMPETSASPVSPATGTEIRCRGWRQEAILRMLENTVHNGERPQDLIIYAASGQAARNWPSFHAIVATLKELADDETLVVQSGKPVARFRTSPASPRVLIANTNLVGNHADWETFFDLRDRGLISYGQYTAGAWQYIGQQGIVQTTYETFTAVAHRHFGGSLRGRLVVTAGLGGMGGAQPLSIKLHGAVALVIEHDGAKIDRRIASGYLDCRAAGLDEAIALAEAALAEGRGLSIGLAGNAADLLPEILGSSLCPDVVTDQTSAHDMRDGYIPSGLSDEELVTLRRDHPRRYEELAYATVARHVEAMVRAQDAGAVVFEYGNAIREQAARAGYERANDFDGFVKAYIRPYFCVGKGPCRWVALSGDPADIRRIDEAILETFADDPAITGWIEVAMEAIPHQGLPARSSWFRYGQRLEFGLMVNELVRSGAVSAPVTMTRDHLDSGAVAQPTRETEGMLDGSDAVADWPILNALLNASGGAELVAVHQGGGSGMGGTISAGVTLVIDGTDECAAKLRRVLTTDPGIGVIRHADAGYAEALDVVAASDLTPVLLGPAGTDGR